MQRWLIYYENSLEHPWITFYFVTYIPNYADSFSFYFVFLSSLANEISFFFSKLHFVTLHLFIYFAFLFGRFYSIPNFRRITCRNVIQYFTCALTWMKYFCLRCESQLLLIPILYVYLIVSQRNTFEIYLLEALLCKDAVVCLLLSTEMVFSCFFKVFSFMHSCSRDTSSPTMS